MGVERVEAWRSSDGQLFRERAAAAAYETKITLKPLLEQVVKKAWVTDAKEEQERLVEAFLLDMVQRPGAYQTALNCYLGHHEPMVIEAPRI